MDDSIELTVNGRVIRANPGETVAAALLNAGETMFRESPDREPRMPLCGMGVCHECRVAIDGEPHRRACMTVVRRGMQVVTDAEAKR